MDNLAELFDRWGSDKARNGYAGAYANASFARAGTTSALCSKSASER